ncbi:hypothetical protein ACQPTN_07585 [Bradyrhizobium sp. 13971]
MIREVLNREFVLAQMDTVLAELKKRASARRGGTASDHEPVVEKQEYSNAVSDVEAAKGREQGRSSGATGFQARPRQRGQASASLDETCFISSDPVVSITQSALEEYFDHPHSRDHVDESAVASARRGVETTAPVTDRSLAAGLPLPRAASSTSSR